jgi:hypothetical protein
MIVFTVIETDKDGHETIVAAYADELPAEVDRASRERAERKARSKRGDPAEVYTYECDELYVQ